eukprot:GFUD01133002.1.p1 GENE.GFUD01133002.1~~GFUD01133002.1.p1  ORF type:complete len:141 (+),score=33.56 GFUD01133002.1:3-425(+)
MFKRCLIKFGKDDDTIAIDCSNTEVDEGLDQPISIVVSASSVIKNKVVEIHVTKGKDIVNKGINHQETHLPTKKLKNHEKEIFKFDEEMDAEHLDEFSSPFLSSENPIVLTLSDSEDENDFCPAHPSTERDATEHGLYKT